MSLPKWRPMNFYVGLWTNVLSKMKGRELTFLPVVTHGSRWSEHRALEFLFIQPGLKTDLQLKATSSHRLMVSMNNSPGTSVVVNEETMCSGGRIGFPQLQQEIRINLCICQERGQARIPKALAAAMLFKENLIVDVLQSCWSFGNFFSYRSNSNINWKSQW